MQRSERLAALLIFLFALLPRALSGRFLTLDEAYHWYDRAALFTAALARGDYAGTNLIGHPGVTTLWLAAIGAWLEGGLAAIGAIPAGDPDGHRMLLRLPLAVVAALCIALALPLLRRLLGARMALLAGLLWAGEPFLVAHAQLLHLDSLLTSWMMLSVLALLVAALDDRMWPSPGTRAPGRPIRLVIVSGIYAGLALLTKSPSLALIPVAGLILLGAALRSGIRGLSALARLAAPLLAIWLLAAAVVWCTLWPAVWVDPAGAITRVFLQAQADGGSPHGWGNFFLGTPVSDPGPFFYPVAVALRLAPWTQLGLLALALLVLVRLRQVGLSGLRMVLLGREGFVLAALAGFVLLFTLMMSVPPKKFDRYALPIFPALDLLAAAGLAWAFGLLSRRIHHAKYSKFRSLLHPAAASLLTIVIAGNLAWYHPYELAYFNPLLGGSAVAVRTIPIGWGEGYELAGDYITAQPNGADRPAAALYEPALSPYAPAGAAPLDWAYEPGRVDYAVLYIDHIQRGYKPWLVAPLLGKVQPVETITIHGIDYAYIYQIAPPVAFPRAAGFGDAIGLRGYDLDTSMLRSSGFITVTLQWEGRATPSADYTLFVHVLDGAGERVGNVDVPPEPRWPTGSWGTGRYITTVQRVPLPADLPAGVYRVVIGLYDPADFRRLPLHAPPEDAEPAAGPDAFRLASFQVR